MSCECIIYQARAAVEPPNSRPKNEQMQLLWCPRHHVWYAKKICGLHYWNILCCGRWTYFCVADALLDTYTAESEWWNLLNEPVEQYQPLDPDCLMFARKFSHSTNSAVLELLHHADFSTWNYTKQILGGWPQVPTWCVLVTRSLRPGVPALQSFDYIQWSSEVLAVAEHG